MDSIQRAQDAYERLERSVAEHPSTGSMGLLSWQIGAGIVGLLEAVAGVLLTLAAPAVWLIGLVPLVSGVLLLTSVFTRHRWVPGVFGTMGTVTCGVAVYFALIVLAHR